MHGDRIEAIVFTDDEVGCAHRCTMERVDDDLWRMSCTPVDELESDCDQVDV